MQNGYANNEKTIQQHLKLGDTEYLKRLQKDNRIILHNYKVPISKDYYCELEGCSAPHNIRLIPDQVLYPRYCSEHRTPHRREQFLTNQNKI